MSLHKGTMRTTKANLKGNRRSPQGWWGQPPLYKAHSGLGNVGLQRSLVKGYNVRQVDFAVSQRASCLLNFGVVITIAVLRPLVEKRSSIESH